MITKLVPLEHVVRKVVDDFNLNTTDIPWESMVDWIAYGLTQIGSYAQYAQKSATLTYTNYGALLPGDFHRVDADKFTVPHRVHFDKILFKEKEGTIILHYLAMPTDSRGFPMVPDDNEFINALYWLIISKMILRGDLKHPEISYQYADDRWTGAIASARAAANMGDIQFLQRRSNNARQMKYDTDPLFNGFNTNGSQIILKRDGNN
jgi:hypothetical protein